MILDVTALVLAAFPLLLTLANLRLYRTPAPADASPCLSVLVPVRNEERNIGATVACVLASEGVDLEVVVLDDHSTDRTRAILAGFADLRLRITDAPPLPAGWSGKQHACAALAREATHELMVFIDADVRLAPDALARIAGFMARNDVGLASGFPRQIVRSWAEQMLLPLMHFLLLGYLPMFVMRDSLSPALGAGCGQLFVARRAAYVKAGGHAAIRTSLHDGITLPRAFRRAGIMTGLFDASRIASCRMYVDAAEVWEGLTKNATEGMAKPVALPVWTAILGIGQVLPIVLLAVDGTWIAAAATACSFGNRALLAWRFRSPFAGVVVHPVGVLALLVIQWSALLRAARGVPATWRGRTYPAQ
ncbi:MAG TPA: glycosyltransferase family 2 protein [Acetobacteraceae bacterium]|nr:glycosyltransferase family 2 protein [Acetobacteraceae bacterium]